LQPKISAKNGYCTGMLKFADVLNELDCGHVLLHVFDELQLLIVRLVSDKPLSKSTPSSSGFAANQLAYVITTSGTTGVPKIVRVPHQCIVPNIKHLR